MKGYMFFHIAEYQLHVSFCVQTCERFLKSGNENWGKNIFKDIISPLLLKRETKSNNQV